MRLLGVSEQRFVRAGTYTGRSVSVVGDLDAAAMGAAFVALQRAYPVTTCRIEEDEAGRGYLLRQRDLPTVGMWLRNGEPAVLLLPAGPIDPAVQLAYLDVVLSDQGRARVTLYAHHSVADGGHCVELLSRLWDFYTEQVEAGTITAVPHGYPQSLEWHVAARGIVESSVSGLAEITVPLSPEAKSVPADPVVAATAALVQPVRTVLDAEATARIIDTAHRWDLTVNALVTAALLRAYASEKARGPLRLGCMYPVDIRPRLDPPIASAEGTNMAGLSSFAAEIDPDADIIELAQGISSRLRDDLAEGIVQQSVLHFPDYFGPSRIYSLAGHVAVTNTGVVPTFGVPSGIELVDYEIVYLSAHPRPSRGASAAVTFLVYTFEGRMAVGILCADINPDRLIAAVHTEFTAFSEQPVPW